MVAALALTVCLSWGGLSQQPVRRTDLIVRDVGEAINDPQTQWIAVLCAGIYSAMFFLLRRLFLPSGSRSVALLDFYRNVFLLLAASAYFLEYHHALQSAQAVTLFGCAALGSGATVDVFRGCDAVSNTSSLRRFLTAGVLILLAMSFWMPGGDPKFHYMTNARWVGHWENPNLYGLLMASGAVLAIGLALSEAGEANALSSIQKFCARLKGTLILAAAAATCFGLFKSYSRGAWIAAGISIIFLLIQRLKRTGRHSLLPTCPFLVVFTVCALFVLLFWHSQHTESATARRAISTFNRNDFSWQNRVSAWEGALQMMAEKPCLGLGWNQPESYYGHYYSASKLDGTAAIQLNDYFMLGAALGAPTLFCFGMYLGLTFAGRSKFKAQSSNFEIQNSDTQELEWHKAVCRSGELALAAGFWFDGGLFKLPTAAMFWILLELGRSDC